MRKLSFNLAIMPEVTALFADDDLSVRLATARAHGFTGIEGQVPKNLDAKRVLLQEHQMQYACMSFARGNTAAGELGVTALPGREDEFKGELNTAIRAAVALGCPMIHPMAGRVPEGAERTSYWEVYRKNLRFACKAAADAGVRVIVEPICAARQPLYLLNTLAQGAELLEVAGDLLIMGDTYHAHMSGESISEFARKHAHSIGLFQVAGAPIRRQPSPDDKELLASVQTLTAQGWKGWYSGEYVPEGDVLASLAWTSVIPS
ncbi:hypothetical protein AU184_08800 [Mycolicibacterium novocastrense]|uniref:TIM barrel protein n=1 Tax=Mycolicibacterium novocastrense TaxID=59813 RepID=UPI0007466A4B|nr:TIM barrel protein [Mycolicibacterium novocastrense]KUH69814.1 hypothetical protein AU184_08800 [Mycolicibacterium novocastrense]KUH71363.1 hypothetical protein AU183_06170 [Mycolicibacterium novocastrense]KUH74427.1 hypothetical protein AU072_17585 [Mycolicibacterium novocastrense]